MARPRLPVEKAKATGAAQNHPKRHAGRVAAPGKPLGEPSGWMGGEQRVAWAGFKLEMPWLKENHRALVEIACTVRARLACGEEVGVQALNLLRQCLGQMGGTPADESKVATGDEAAPEKPEDQYFN